MTLEQIERLCADYGKRRDALHDRLIILEGELTTIKNRHLKEIKRCTALAAESESTLRAAIEDGPDLFAKPKTHIFHGIKVGYRKGTGALDWADDEELVRKIEKMFADVADEYLLVKKKPRAEALEACDAATLKRLGVQVGDDGEQVVIKPVETAIERLVKALLKDAREDANADS
ncbi:MAG: hypothetical protein H8K07_01510 [Nitrospira sp.]|nr:hypothetical protein [Nitrospira sp.]